MTAYAVLFVLTWIAATDVWGFLYIIIITISSNNITTTTNNNITVILLFVFHLVFALGQSGVDHSQLPPQVLYQDKNYFISTYRNFFGSLIYFCCILCLFYCFVLIYHNFCSCFIRDVILLWSICRIGYKVHNCNFKILIYISHTENFAFCLFVCLFIFLLQANN